MAVILMRLYRGPDRGLSSLSFLKSLAYIKVLRSFWQASPRGEAAEMLRFFRGGDGHIGE
jgi:hypothetical protein